MIKLVLVTAVDVESDVRSDVFLATTVVSGQRNNPGYHSHLHFSPINFILN